MKSPEQIRAYRERTNVVYEGEDIVFIGALTAVVAGSGGIIFMGGRLINRVTSHITNKMISSLIEGISKTSKVTGLALVGLGLVGTTLCGVSFIENTLHYNRLTKIIEEGTGK